MNFLKKYFFIFLGFFIGLVFFFPWNQVKDFISSTVVKSSGIVLNIQNLEATLGLRIGLMKGSLIGFSASGAQLHSPAGFSLNCDELIIAPRLWPLLMGQIQVGLGCLEKDKGSFSTLLKASPFWSPSNMNISIKIEKFSLENLNLQNELHGVFSGTLEITDLPLSGQGLPLVAWNLQGSEVRSPSLPVLGLTLNSLDLDEVKTVGTFGRNSIKIPTLNFGSPQTLIQAKLSYESDFPLQSKIPENGQLTGTLRVSPSAELSIFKNFINFTQAFGPADTTGTRQITKKFSGGIQKLIF